METLISTFDFPSVINAAKSLNLKKPEHVKTLHRYRRNISSLTVSMWDYTASHGANYLIADHSDVACWYYSEDNLSQLVDAVPLEKQYHTHNYYELMYVQSGALNEWIEEECIPLRRGDAILLDKSIRHIEEYTQPATCIFVSLDDSCVQRLLASEPAFSAGQSVMHFLLSHLESNEETQKAYYRFIAADVQQEDLTPIEKELNIILTEMIKQQPGHQLLIQGYLRRLLGILESAELYQSLPVYKAAGQRETLMEKICFHMEEYQGTMRKEELGALLNYNTAYLCRVIKESLGKSFTQYSLSIRINSAAQMLRSTDWSVTAICEKLHFANHTYFYREFNNVFHVTPGDYRAANKHKEVIKSS